MIVHGGLSTTTPYGVHRFAVTNRTQRDECARTDYEEPYRVDRCSYHEFACCAVGCTHRYHSDDSSAKNEAKPATRLAPAALTELKPGHRAWGRSRRFEPPQYAAGVATGFARPKPQG